MTASREATLDLGEFLEQVFWEVLSGIEIAVQAGGVSRTLQITRVRVRFGAQEAADPRAAESAGMVDTALSASAPWQVDVFLDPDRPTGILDIGVAELVGFASRHGTPGGSPFDDLAVTAIQGVGSAYARFLARQGIDTIRQLAEHEDLKVFGSRQAQVREFRTKARLVRSPRPLVWPCPADSASLSSLALKSPEELYRLIGRDAVTLARCRHLSAYLDLLLMALDDRLLQNVTLRRLVDG